MPTRLPAFFLCALLAVPQTGGKRFIRWTDLSPIVRQIPGLGTAADFRSFVESIEADTKERLRRGELEHLIYFVLQSRSFTAKAPIEPAACAKQFAQEGSVPAAVKERVRDFRNAPLATDSRLRYFRRIAPEDWRPAFRDAMEFLYRKEFEAGAKAGANRRESVARLYETRGHSSDSSFEANFAPYLALSARARDGNPRIRRVLIVGPGLDYAPRAGFDDRKPQSYQPYALADSLLRLGLATQGDLSLHCVDINSRVVEFLQHPTPVLEFRAGPGTREYEDFVQSFGRAIGTRDNGIVRLSPEIQHSITADRLNIVTERYDPSPAYDLIVATNVLVYMNNQELILALANLSSMLRPGGLLIHNDLRGEIESAGRALGMPVIDARLIRLYEDERQTLMDSAVVHQRSQGI